MSAIARIIEVLNWISDAFYRAYQEIIDLPWPFWYAAHPFYSLSVHTNSLAWAFYDFYDWVMEVESRVGDILDWHFIWSQIMLYVPNLEAIGDWFSNWRFWVYVEIAEWWLSTRLTVYAWLASTRDWAWLWIEILLGQINELKVMIQDLQGAIPDLSAILAWFSNWTGYVLTFVNTWWTSKVLEVQGLINSAFIIRTDFWAGWQDWRDKVTEFFTDPEDWLYKSADRIVERFW